jgi:hypothetical protein
MPDPSKPTLSDRYWRLPWIARIGAVVAVGLVGLFLFGLLGRDATTPTSRTPATAGPAASPATGSAVLPAGQIGPGEWLVGTDVQPGTYRSDGPAEPGGYCMWSRKDAAGAGPLDNIIASDGSYDAGQMLVTIAATDVVFRTRGCAPFQPVS